MLRLFPIPLYEWKGSVIIFDSGGTQYGFNSFTFFWFSDLGGLVQFGKLIFPASITCDQKFSNLVFRNE